MRTSAQERVRNAEAELAVAENNLQRSARPLRAQLQHHRSATLLLGGFATGVALTLLPTRWWGRIGAVAGTLSAAAARSLLTPAFMGAAFAKLRDKKPSAATSASE
jgi:hypothetical protein